MAANGAPVDPNGSAGSRLHDKKLVSWKEIAVHLGREIRTVQRWEKSEGLPVRRHEHRMWTATPEDRRAALSKRNFYRFLDRWRGRFDLTVAGRRRGSS